MFSISNNYAPPGVPRKCGRSLCRKAPEAAAKRRINRVRSGCAQLVNFSIATTAERRSVLGGFCFCRRKHRAIGRYLLWIAEMAPQCTMPSRNAPEPEYVVLCADSVDWHDDAELIAASGHPMLLHGSSDRDFDFAQDLMTKHKLKSSIDLPNKKFLLWKTKPAALPSWHATT